MADTVIFIGFANPVRGREKASEKVFGEAMEYWGRLQAAGEIEGADAVLLEAHGGDLGGFFLLKGEADKLARVRASEETRRLLVRANLIVDGLGVVAGVTGNELARQMGLFLEAAGDLA
ncbi:MAG TPA: hypothetical protein VJ787_08640 [Thermoleophilia bacterium]|nr:hypothetical protein [Thermoleophilia bacterium]